MIHFITSYVIIPANPQQPIHCPKCNRWSFIDSDRLAKSKISGGFSPPSSRGKMMVGEWVRHLGGWHSQYDGKVIIQPCSSHQQPEEYHVISNPNISPILIQYCSSYTSNKFFRCGPQEVNFFGIRSPRSPVLRQSLPASRESEHFKRVIVQIESPNMAAKRVKAHDALTVHPKALWRRWWTVFRLELCDMSCTIIS